MASPSDEFAKEKTNNIVKLGSADDLIKASYLWQEKAARYNYVYNFEWFGRPIIQFPQDIVATQEIILSSKPDLIIETGIAHGGSLIFSASMLALLDVAEAIESGATIDPRKSERKVLGIDIDIRAHNRAAIEAHSMSSRIEMIQGSSIDPEVVNQVQNIAKGYERVMVFLDANHTHDHVLAELNAYAPLVSKDSYCIVYDTAIEDVSENLSENRLWGPGNNPKTAVWEWLKTNENFEIDKAIPNKLLITVAPDGYLKRL